jgi:hypothetical protein
LTQEQFHSAPVGCIRNDFDVNEFEREEEDRISDAVSSSSDESDDDHGGTDAMPSPIAPMPVPVRAMPTPVPAKVLHAMPTQGRLIHDLSEDDTPYDSWGRISEAQPYVPPPPYTTTDLMQLWERGLPFSGVLNYRDVSMTHMAVCDTGLQMYRNSLYNPE